MPTLVFEGYSDDTFGEYGHTNCDHDNAASGEPIEFVVETEDYGLLVVGQYAHTASNKGTWLIGVSPAYEGSMPPWPMRFTKGNRPYSPALHIEVPDGFEMQCITAIEAESE